MRELNVCLCVIIINQQVELICVCVQTTEKEESACKQVLVAVELGAMDVRTATSRLVAVGQEYNNLFLFSTQIIVSVARVRSLTG